MADGHATATVIVQSDPGVSVTLTSSRPGDRLTIGTDVTDEDGIAVAYLSSTAGGTSTITATVRTTTAQADVVFDPLTAACTGTLQLPFAPASSISPSLRALDIDGDGDLDLEGGGAIDSHQVLRNRGDGTFDPATTIPMGVLSDVDRDGIPDVVAAAGQELHVQLGNGDGTFGTAIVTAVGRGVADLAVGDFDGDGNGDVVFTSEGVVVAALGIGDGRFGTASPTAIALPPSPKSTLLLTADLDENGRADVVAISSSTESATTMDVALADVAGSFPSHTEVPLVDNIPIELIWIHARKTLLEDIDGDGHVDLATVGNTDPTIDLESTELYLLRGRGDGGFEPVSTVELGRPFLSFASTDIDHDGVRDLVIAPSVSGPFWFTHGNGDGSFAAPTPVAGGEHIGEVVTAGDFDGNGRDDLVAYDATSGAVLLRDDDSHFGPPTTALVFADAGIVAFRVSDQRVVDIDRDGHPDIVAAFQGRVDGDPSRTILATFRGHGDGTFEPGVMVSNTFGGEPRMALGDIDRDGDPDLVIERYPGADVYLNAGGAFTLVASVDAEGPVLGLLDLDDDGRLDLITQGNRLKGDGHGGFVPDAGLPFPISVVGADFNNDGVIDSMSVTQEADPTSPSLVRQVVDIQLGGGVLVRSPVDAPLGLGQTYAFADLDRDGNVDIIGRFGVVMLGDGTGAFGAAKLYPWITGIGDVNHDGALDTVHVARVGLQTCAP